MGNYKKIKKYEYKFKEESPKKWEGVEKELNEAAVAKTIKEIFDTVKFKVKFYIPYIDINLSDDLDKILSTLKSFRVKYSVSYDKNNDAHIILVEGIGLNILEKCQLIINNFSTIEKIRILLPRW